MESLTSMEQASNQLVLLTLIMLMIVTQKSTDGHVFYVREGLAS